MLEMTEHAMLTAIVNILFQFSMQTLHMYSWCLCCPVSLGVTICVCSIAVPLLVWCMHGSKATPSSPATVTVSSAVSDNMP